jgi:hypothetical protein
MFCGPRSFTLFSYGMIHQQMWKKSYSYQEDVCEKYLYQYLSLF